MIKILLLYLAIVAAVGGVLYGSPALREIPKIHKAKLVLSVAIGFILLIIIYVGEQIS